MKRATVKNRGNIQEITLKKTLSPRIRQSVEEEQQTSNYLNQEHTVVGQIDLFLVVKGILMLMVLTSIKLNAY